MEGADTTPGLEPRVRQLELSVEALHADSAKTQQALAILSSQVTQITKTLDAVADKLDAARTSKTPWGVIAAWASVVVIIGTLALKPTADKVDHLTAEVAGLQQIIQMRQGNAYSADEARQALRWERERTDAALAEINQSIQALHAEVHSQERNGDDKH